MDTKPTSFKCLGDCRKLKGLVLSVHEITGWIPQNIGNLSELMELYVNGNNLESAIQPCSFTNLQWLD